MNILLSCIGKRGYVARFFRQHLPAGGRIIATSNSRWTSGFHSCDQSYLVPDVESADYIPAILEICRRERIDALLSFYDPDVYRLSGHVPEFQALGVRCFIPSLAAAGICFDKWRTFEFLTRHGISTADTYDSLHSAKAALACGRLTFPVYVKPRWGFGSRNTFAARDPGELEACFGMEPDMLIQETLGGEAFNFDILNDLEGRPLAVVPWRKFLSRMGETEQSRTVEEPRLLELGQRLATLLGHAGPLDADLFFRNGSFYVLEINLRFGGGYPVSHLAGADFTEAIVQMTRGERPSIRMGEYRRDMVMMKELHILGGPADSFFRAELRIDESLRQKD